MRPVLLAATGEELARLDLSARLSGSAQAIRGCLQARGASFFSELLHGTRLLASEVENGLWELVAAGLVTADGFDNLRSLIDPKRRRAEASDRSRRPRHVGGRWSSAETDGKPSAIIPALSSRTPHRLRSTWRGNCYSGMAWCFGICWGGSRWFHPGAICWSVTGGSN
jgi:hypothetical protein